jgi:hypothetical protein
MKKNRSLLNYLEHRLGSSSGSGIEKQFSCPQCVEREGDESSKRKLWVNVDKGAGVCFRCGYKFRSMMQFFRDLNGGKLTLEEIALIENQAPTSDAESVRHTVIKLLYGTDADGRGGILKPYDLPTDAVPLTEKSREGFTCKAAWNYLLTKRKVAVEKVLEWKIYYCRLGDYANRLIFPVWQGGRSVYWTNRYCGSTTLKTKNPENREGYFGKSDCLLNYDNCIGAERVFVAEGPFSAMAFDYAVALMGKTASPSQILLLKELARKGTKEFVIALDADASAHAQALFQSLSGRLPNVSLLSFDHGDPDERRDDLDGIIENRSGFDVSALVRSRLGR